MSIGNRGKSAEDAVKARFELRAKKASFAYYRLPDARAGSFKAALADFQAIDEGVFWLIEVKEVNNKNNLPYGNWPKDKISRMRAWELAGGKVLLLVHHKSLGLWRGTTDFTRFASRPEDRGSWDLQDLPAVELEKLV